MSARNNGHNVDCPRRNENNRRDRRSSSSSRDEEFHMMKRKIAQLQQEVNILKRKRTVSPGYEERDDGFQRRKEKWLRERFGRYGNSSGSDNEERFANRRLANVEQKLEELIFLEKRNKINRGPSFEKTPAQSRRTYSAPFPPFRPKGDESESFEDRSYSTDPKLRSEIRRTYSDDLRCFYCKILGHISRDCWFRQRDFGYETPLDYLGYERRESRSGVRDS
ncbi:uncharacterized protein LOC135843810 [Planococcus citri]|uniref:uncharacterized protein LOC135843810 n=1 Tax=Planococcus citri TaxID=170843 RepID=UPI0031F9BEDA